MPWAMFVPAPSRELRSGVPMDLDRGESGRHPILLGERPVVKGGNDLARVRFHRPPEREHPRPGRARVQSVERRRELAFLMDLAVPGDQRDPIVAATTTKLAAGTWSQPETERPPLKPCSSLVQSADTSMGTTVPSSRWATSQGVPVASLTA